MVIFWANGVDIPPSLCYTRYTEREACTAVVVEAISEFGGMAEWTMATVLKTVVAARSPGVRIPLPPPDWLMAEADGK
jgi:hypothetical protein